MASDEAKTLLKSFIGSHGYIFLDDFGQHVDRKIAAELVRLGWAQWGDYESPEQSRCLYITNGGRTVLDTLK